MGAMGIIDQGINSGGNFDRSPDGSLVLPKRWTRLVSHDEQIRAFRSPKRFNVIPAGRRSGKTEIIGKRKMALRAMLCHDQAFPQYYSPWPDPKYFIAAPTRDQVKRIYWSDMKSLIPPAMLAKPPNESSLILSLLNGAELYLMGLDKPERIEGSPWDWGLVDEIANVKPQAWPENIRPSLSDRRGGCDFIGVPEGRNHYWEMYDKALRSMEMLGEDSEWAAFTWFSADILPPEEIAAARMDLDPLVFQQEYEASFVSFTGLAYYNFDRKVHVGRYRQYYNKQAPLVLTFDFNVSPGTANIIQEMDSSVFDVPKTVSVSIGEVYIPQQSNTERICKKIIEDWSRHEGLVICYGDATGGADGTAKVKGTDWDLIKQKLYPVFGERLYFKIPKKNPRERQRINAVNSRMLTATGDVRYLVDGEYCPWTVRDFEGVRVIEGSAGEIDKKTDKKLTHMSDGIGYYMHREFPVGRYYTKQDIKELEEAARSAAAQREADNAREIIRQRIRDDKWRGNKAA